MCGVHRWNLLGCGSRCLHELRGWHLLDCHWRVDLLQLQRRDR